MTLVTFMNMKKNTDPLLPDTFYHIYNRGNNGERLFIEERNYDYFLGLWAKHIEPVAETYAYCLLGNHFHFLVRSKSDPEIIVNLKKEDVEEPNTSRLISNQFAKLFNAYTQAINKAYGRTGKLFEAPFRRIPVLDDAYFSQLVAYIHKNPEKHGFVEDFREYPHSSYMTNLLPKRTKLKRAEVISWFGGKEAYQEFHRNDEADEEMGDYWID